jgi:hypothetical protein
MVRCNALTPFQGTSWILIGIIGIIWEILLITTPAYMIWGMQIPTSSKIVVISAFAFRIPLLAIPIVRLVFLMGARSSTDYTFDVVPTVIFTQVEMHYALLAATIPCMRPFLKALNSGYLSTVAVQVDRTLVVGAKDGSNSVPSRCESVPLEDRSRSRATIRSPQPSSGPLPPPEPNFSQPRPRADSTPPQLPPTIPEENANFDFDFPNSSPGTVDRSPSAHSDCDRGSHSSYGSEQMIIKKDTTYTVRFDGNV